MHQPLRPESIVVAAGRPTGIGAPLNTPIVPTAPYRSDHGMNRYAREDVSPTLVAFEAALGALEGGAALGFGSGMAAVTTVLDLLPVGAVVVAPHAAYAGLVATLAEREAAGRLSVRGIDAADTDAVCRAVTGADLVWLETVSNPLLVVADVPAVAAAAQAAGALLVVDATFSTPLVARPLDLGADVVMHSATKYLSGHADVLLGALVTRSDDLTRRLHERRTLGGGIPGALEAYLATRGLRTLALRMDRAQANAADLAARLDAHPAVTRVRYPGLPNDAGHAIAARDHTGFGAMLCFELGDAGAADELCARVQLITHATSLGGVESLIERRASHPMDAAFGTPPGMLRLSVGIEHVEDLWADLARALDGLPG